MQGCYHESAACNIIKFVTGRRVVDILKHPAIETNFYSYQWCLEKAELTQKPAASLSFLADQRRHVHPIIPAFWMKEGKWLDNSNATSIPKE